MDVFQVNRGSFLRPLALVLVLVALTDARPTKYEASGVEYLVRFGYLSPQDPRTGALRTEESLKLAVKEFQEFAGLNVTGDLDPVTVELMQTPRCGVADKIGTGVRARRRRRYTIQGSKWPRNRALTYKILNYSPQLTEAEVDDALERAFKVWSDVSQLRFVKKTSGKVDIEIRFASYSHGDGNPFDGRGKTLAHAFFPQFGGDAHFDESESWTVHSSSGTDLFQVAAHEFGHSLGLSHSRVRSALMAPFYRGYVPDFELDSDDVSGIQVLYGAPQRRVTTQRPTTRVGSVGGRDSSTARSASRTTGEICRNSKIDAMTRTKDGLTYVFKGMNYYRLNSDGMDSGYPRRISWDWDGVTGPVDAVLTLRSGNTYIFKGSQYWKFVNQKAVSGYPREIRYGFRGIPSNLDSAFTWSGNGEAYFVKGTKYYRYSFATYGVAPGYPRPLASWKGLPSTIDAALKWENDRTYFFKDGNYYRFNDRAFRVDPDYPRSNAKWWFGCGEPRSSQPQQDPASGILEATNNEDQYSGPVLPDTDTDNNGGTRPLKPDGNATGSQSAASHSVVLTTFAILLAALWP